MFTGNDIAVGPVTPLLGALAVEKRLGEAGMAGSGFWGDGRASALFLAYLAAETPAPDARQTAERIARSSRPRPRTTAETAGAIYTLSHLAALWGYDDLVDRAEQLLPRIADSIDREAARELGGVIPALLALHAVRPESLALALALRCGDRLLELSQFDAGGRRWANLAVDGEFRGSVGDIASALMRLGFPRFTDGARAALAGEREAVRYDSPVTSALARLAMYRETGDLVFVHDARRALLVCQNGGNPLVLLEVAGAAGEVWPAEERWGHQRLLAVRLLLHAVEERNWSALEAASPAGLPGIGLALLRATQPARIPSLFLLDFPVSPRK